MQHYLLSLPPLLLLQLLLPSQLLLAAAALSLDLRKAAAPTVAAALGARTAAFDAEDGEEAIRLGAAAYSQLLKESSEEGAASSCWQQVSEQLLLLQQQTHEDACSSRGEAFRELIALTRMRCIYARSGRPFPGPAEGCYLFPHEVPLDWIGVSHVLPFLSHGCLSLRCCLRYPFAYFLVMPASHGKEQAPCNKQARSCLDSPHSLILLPFFGILDFPQVCTDKLAPLKVLLQ